MSSDSFGRRAPLVPAAGGHFCCRLSKPLKLETDFLANVTCDCVWYKQCWYWNAVDGCFYSSYFVLYLMKGFYITIGLIAPGLNHAATNTRILYISRFKNEMCPRLLLLLSSTQNNGNKNKSILSCFLCDPRKQENQIKGKLHAQVDGLHNVAEYSGWFIGLMETNGNQWLPGECRKTAFSYKCKTDLQLLSFLIDLLMICKLMEVNGCL